LAQRRSPRSATPAEEPSPPRLTVPSDALAAQLDDRILRGREIADRAIHTEADLQSARHEYYTWTEYNETLLQRSFTTAQPADDYRGVAFAVGGGAASLAHEVEWFRNDVREKIRRLTSVREQLPLYESVEASAVRTGASAPPGARDTIFVVHGHNAAAKEQAASFLSSTTQLRPVILHEQPNSGRTVIEKFEDYAGNAAFAVILLTGDDEGGIRGSGETHPRGRQNVVFELGFFVAALERSRVAVLYEEGVELPSDMSGVLYTPLDAGGAWKLALARELRAAGVDVDLNRVI
jgi:predicted nucleotide-binding protein